MSRTYRSRDHVQRECNCGAPIYSFHRRSDHEEIVLCQRKGVIPWRDCHCNTWYHDNHKRNFKRDRKDRDKPDKKYKTVSKRLRRAKVRNAMAQKRYDCMPVFKKTDVWNWN